VTELIALAIMNLATPKAATKHELLFNKPTSAIFGSFFEWNYSRKKIIIYSRGCQLKGVQISYISFIALTEANAYFCYLSNNQIFDCFYNITFTVSLILHCLPF